MMMKWTIYARANSGMKFHAVCQYAESDRGRAEAFAKRLRTDDDMETKTVLAPMNKERIVQYEGKRRHPSFRRVGIPQNS